LACPGLLARLSKHRKGIREFEKFQNSQSRRVAHTLRQRKRDQIASQLPRLVNCRSLELRSAILPGWSHLGSRRCRICCIHTNIDTALMNSLIEKVRSRLPALDKQGAVYLYALFEREDAPGKWDIVLSSDWSDKDATAANRFVSNEVVPLLDSSERAALSRVIVIPLSATSLRDRLGDLCF
jgi:hypothetical protein